MDPESGTGIRWVQALTLRRAPEYGLDAVKALQGALPRGGFSRRTSGDPTLIRRGGACAARARWRDPDIVGGGPRPPHNIGCRHHGCRGAARCAPTRRRFTPRGPHRDGPWSPAPASRRLNAPETGTDAPNVTKAAPKRRRIIPRGPHRSPAPATGT